MALKDTWKDLEDEIDGVPDSGSDITVEPINAIAHAVIKLEEDSGGDVDLSNYYTKEEVNELFATKEELGDIEEATAAIIALQNSYIGGETV